MLLKNECNYYSWRKLLSDGSELGSLLPMSRSTFPYRQDTIWINDAFLKVAFICIACS